MRAREEAMKQNKQRMEEEIKGQELAAKLHAEELKAKEEAERRNNPEKQAQRAQFLAIKNKIGAAAAP